MFLAQPPSAGSIAPARQNPTAPLTIHRFNPTPPASLRTPPSMLEQDEKTMTLSPADVTRVLPIATQAVLVPPLTSISVGTDANSDSPSASRRSHAGRTPPGTPPARLASPCSPHAPHSVHSEGSVDSGGSPHGSVGKGTYT